MSNSLIRDHRSQQLTNNSLIVTCPHCKEPIIIKKINCGIFRHGAMKTTGKQLKPHLDKSACELLIKNDAIYGCGKPFRIIKGEAIVCDYV